MITAAVSSGSPEGTSATASIEPLLLKLVASVSGVLVFRSSSVEIDMSIIMKKKREQRIGSTSNFQAGVLRVIALASTKVLMLQISNEQELERITKE